MRPAVLLALALVTAACGEATEEAPLAAPVSEPEGTGVTSILNAGVMARMGQDSAPVKFLFDPLYDDHFGTLEPLDDGLVERIVSGTAPYDGVTAVLVSHAHGDHFSARQFNRLMDAQPEIRVVAPKQAIEQMRSADGWNPTFAARITEIALDNGEQADSFEIAGVEIEAFRSPHTGWPDRHADVHNITYRVSASDGADAFTRVMHFGDADPARTHYAAQGEFLSSARTGLAIVPYWHFGTANPDALVDETFNAEEAVGMHVPVEVPGWLRRTDRTYFTGEGQAVEIPATP